MLAGLTVSPSAARAEAAIRFAINLGNPVLARRAPDGTLAGISVDLASGYARKLGQPALFVSYPSAGEVFAAAGTDEWDVAFLAVDPVRAQGLHFTAPYLWIDGGYLVQGASPYQAIRDVDRAGVRVAVARGSAYDLFLSRALTQAGLVRAPTGDEAVALFISGEAEVAAGIKSPLLSYAGQHENVRVLPGRFMRIEQAMAVPQEQAEAINKLRTYVEMAKVDGTVTRLISLHGQTDAEVAAPV